MSDLTDAEPVEAMPIGAPSGPLADLHAQLGELHRLLVTEVEACNWLDAFLIAAGIDQILEDILHPDPLGLGTIAKRCAAASSRTFQAGGRVVAAARVLLSAASAARSSFSGVAQCHRAASELLTGLATRVIGADGRDEVSQETLLKLRAQKLGDRVAGLPERILRHRMRPPACYWSFDQHPRDLHELIGSVVAGWPDRQHPILVLGIRTSGSYLAPLGEAELRAHGYSAVSRLTFRPRRGWSALERKVLKRSTANGALVIVLDDPPMTWGAVTETTEALLHAGFPRRSVVLALQTFPTTPAPPRQLATHPMALLSWEDWHVHQSLMPSSVRLTLSELLAPTYSVTRVQRQQLCEEFDRGHTSALYEAELTSHDGERTTRLILAQGVGLGYLGRAAEQVVSRLSRFFPTVYGTRHGLLFRQWLPEEARPRQASTELKDVAATIVSYVCARSRALATPADGKWLMSQASVWRWARQFLSRGFGRGAYVAYPLVTFFVRNVLQPRYPSVVDGSNELQHWFRSPSGAQLVKVGFAQRPARGLDVYCYDPVFDLAATAASAGSDVLADDLRRRYAQQSGERVAPERWLLYQLAHDELQTDNDVDDPELERTRSRRLQSYIAELFLSQTPPPARDGFLCALDLDGVLESSPLAVSTMDATAAVALRALLTHGHSPVIASGRSIGEVRERCIRYRLAGGVAEYGAAIYSPVNGGHVHSLLTEEQCNSLESLRSMARLVPGIRIDCGYRYAVRAYGVQDGTRRGLRQEELEELSGALGDGAIQVIEGRYQTDFMVAGVNKATGLRALARDLGISVENAGWLSFAIGDTPADLEMLALATHAFAPAEADLQLARSGVRILRRAGQAGVREAVGRLILHPPGSCPTCREPNLTPAAQLMLDLAFPPTHLKRPAKHAHRAAILVKLAIAAIRATTTQCGSTDLPDLR